MSKIGLVIVLILMAGRNYAQQDYFVLIQSDNNQPFYARVGGESRTISSSAQGHLILSQLKEGSYTITIGFPKKLFPEHQFSFTIYKKDFEFQLKDLGEKGWGLFNPQTLELKMPDEKKEDDPKNHLEGVKKDDAFSRLMAGVVSDTAVMYNTYAMEATLKDNPVMTKSAPADTPLSVAIGTVFSRVKDDSSTNSSLPLLNPAVPGKDTSGAVAVINSSVGTDVPNETVRPDKSSSGGGADSTTGSPISGSSRTTSVPANPAAFPPPPSSVPSSGPKAGLVVKLSERKTAKGVRLVYADHIKGRKADTIVVIIPVDTGARLVQRPGEVNPPVSSSAPSDTPVLVSTRPDHPATPQNGSGASVQKASVVTPPVRPDSSQKKALAKSLFINSDCRNFATDYDVDKLRVKMLETSKDEDRISVARKVFKTKCFTTRQIRALSEVFTSDAQKFRFFEAAYPFVSDEHFKELTDLLADPVYNSKFRTLTGQQ